MAVKEKLVELLKEAKYKDSVFPNTTYTFGVHLPYSDHILRQVADHLIAHSVTVQEWISVKDRLPEDSTYVLARLSGGAIYEALCLTNGSKQWCAINREPFVNKDTVTHWMPLPQPPKGE